MRVPLHARYYTDQHVSSHNAIGVEWNKELVAFAMIFGVFVHVSTLITNVLAVAAVKGGLISAYAEIVFDAREAFVFHAHHIRMGSIAKQDEPEVLKAAYLRQALVHGEEAVDVPKQRAMISQWR